MDSQGSNRTTKLSYFVHGLCHVRKLLTVTDDEIYGSSSYGSKVKDESERHSVL